jgi:hypothetical protein
MKANTIVAIGLVAVSLVAAVFVACSDSKSCKPGTLALQVELDGTANFADTITITQTDPGATLNQTVTRTAGDKNLFTVDVTWPDGYPAGKTVHLLVRAQGGVQLLGEDVAVIHLSEGCSTGLVAIRSMLLDGGVDDGGTSSP